MSRFANVADLISSSSESDDDDDEEFDMDKYVPESDTGSDKSSLVHSSQLTESEQSLTEVSVLDSPDAELSSKKRQSSLISSISVKRGKKKAK